MVITRSEIVKKLAEKSGYYQKHIYKIMKCFDEVVLEYFGQVTDEEEVMVQLVTGIKAGCSIIPERTRRNPSTQEEITCKPYCKPKVKFSEDFKTWIQDQYENKKSEDG